MDECFVPAPDNNHGRLCITGVRLEVPLYRLLHPLGQQHAQIPHIYFDSHHAGQFTVSLSCASVLCVAHLHISHAAPESPKHTHLKFTKSVLNEISCRLCVELLMLFCPTFTKDNGVLLYYCDKPSLFGRIGKSGS